jgi:D-glycero-alpha-D-manno-heptose-7-phosphate kinase
MDVLREPIGKQDQYAAAYGGLNLITFHPDESVVVEPVVMPPGCQRRLMENLAVFYLGGARSARNILCDQQETVEREKQAFDSLVRMTEIARELRQSLARGDIDAMGPALDENWRLKNRLSRQISKDWIDDCYEKAKRSGAAGGKLLGAGGGGFLLLYCQKDRQPQLAQTLGQFRKIRFAFENVGTSIIHYEGSEE